MKRILFVAAMVVCFCCCELQTQFLAAGTQSFALPKGSAGSKSTASKSKENKSTEKEPGNDSDEPGDIEPGSEFVAAFDNSSGTVGLKNGNLIPEIVGKDVDGVEFRLSDYKGKVIMLDFWGDW